MAPRHKIREIDVTDGWLSTENALCWGSSAGTRIVTTFIDRIDEPNHHLKIHQRVWYGTSHGRSVNITLKPAPENTGYIFVRTDLDNFEIPASVEYISHCSYATTLMRRGVVLSTCEHLLSAFRGSGIDNCFIEIDSIELPIMDGSSEDFIALIEEAGVAEQDAPRRYFRVLKEVKIKEGDRKMSIEPSDKFEIECLIDFKHPFINKQGLHYVAENGSFRREIASARTFGFTQEIEMLRKANLARGGSLENAIVLTPEGMLNETPLRFDDEFVRHKILDIIGDLALFGMSIKGKVTAEKAATRYMRS